MPTTVNLPTHDIVGESLTRSPNAHLVQFFSSSAETMKAVSEYIVGGLKKGEGILLVATQTHFYGIEKELAQGGLELASLVDSQRVVFLDAQDILKLLMTRPNPSRRLFHQHLGKILKEMTEKFPHVRIFGEMVNLLVAEGNLESAMTLEGYWNELALKYPFSLLCGYTLDNFSNDLQSVAATKVCSCHSHWIFKPQGISPAGV